MAGLVLAGGWTLAHRLDRAVDRGLLLAPGARAKAGDGNAGHANLRGPLNFLLIGSDYRTWNPGMGERSDTIIVAHVPAGLDRAYLVSIPRDLRVSVPATLDFPGAVTKINAALEFGRGGESGVQLLSQTLTDLTGVHFDGAAVINFTGLQRAVDVVGGVSMCVEIRTVSVHTGAVFERGCRVMRPAEVLDYLRQRHFPDGDFSRQRHQQQFLKALLGRMTEAGVLANPVKLDAMLQAVASSMTVDTGGVALPDVLLALRDLHPDALVGVRLPYTMELIEGTSYVLATAEADGVYRALREDDLDAWVQANPSWVNRL